MKFFLPVLLLIMLSTASFTSADNVPACAIARLGTTRFRLPGDIRQVKFSPDGKYIAATAPGEQSFYGRVAIFDSASGKRQRSWLGHEGNDIYSISYSPDGKILASAGWSDGVRLWSTETGSLLRHIEMLGDDFTQFIDFSADGKVLAIVVSHFALDLLDLETDDCKRHIISPRCKLDVVALSADGRLIAANDGQNFVVFERSSGDEVLRVEAPIRGTPRVTALAFSPDSRILAVARGDGAPEGVRLFDVTAGEKKPANREICCLVGHQSFISALAWAPDGHVLASGSFDGTIRLWAPATGAELALLEGHRDSVYSLDFSRDGRWLVSGGRDRTIRVWDVEKRAARDAVEPNEGVLNSVAFSPDGKTIACGGEDFTLRLWDVDTRTSRILADRSDDEVAQTAFSSDGKLVFVADGRRRRPSPQRSVRAFDARSGERQFALPCGPNEITCMTLSVDGRLLASSSNDKLVRVWNLATKRTVWEFEPPVNYRPNNVALSPSGELLAIGSHNEKVQLWSVKTRQHIRNLTEHWEPVYAFVFSADGKRLVSGSRDHSAHVYDVDTGRQIFCLGQPVCNMGGPEKPVHPGVLRANGHGDAVSCVACSPDGKLVATGSWDCTVRLWSMASGDHLVTLTGHEGSVKSVAFSPDSRLLVSASSDTTMLVWDVQAALKAKP